MKKVHARTHAQTTDNFVTCELKMENIKTHTNFVLNFCYVHVLMFFKTVLSSGYILILLSIEYILASLIEMCQG